MHDWIISWTLCEQQFTFLIILIKCRFCMNLLHMIWLMCFNFMIKKSYFLLSRFWERIRGLVTSSRGLKKGDGWRVKTDGRESEVICERSLIKKIKYLKTNQINQFRYLCSKTREKWFNLKSNFQVRWIMRLYQEMKSQI